MYVLLSEIQSTWINGGNNQLPNRDDLEKVLKGAHPNLSSEMPATNQKYLKYASPMDRLAFFNDTSEGREMIKQFLIVSDFAAFYNDNFLENNSYKREDNVQALNTQRALLWSAKPDRQGRTTGSRGAAIEMVPMGESRSQ